LIISYITLFIKYNFNILIIKSYLRIQYTAIIQMLHTFFFFTFQNRVFFANESHSSRNDTHYSFANRSRNVHDLLITLRWWYESSHYTDDVVYCWMSTRFWLLSSKWSICRNVSHVTSHYLYLVRLSFIYLIDKIFRSYTDITRKWWNRLFVLNNFFILSCPFIHSFCQGRQLDRIDCYLTDTND
jgi:hypothetical protein